MQQESGSEDVSRRIRRASVLLMVTILLSRIVGFFREWILARTVGASAATDVYYASFTIPDFLNYLMAAGALSLSFIPVFSHFLAEKTEHAENLFRSVLTYLGSALIILICIAEVFAPDLARAIAPGFSEEQQASLSYLIRIILPAQVFFYAGGIATAVQHTHGQFLYAALAPIIYNLCIILFGVWLQPTHGIVGFSVGVLAGAFLGHGLLQWWGLSRLGYSVTPLFHLNAELRFGLKRYLWLSLPIMLGFSIVVTDEWFGKFFATYLGPSNLSYLQYARTEMRIPVAVIGQAAGVASFPFLARLWSSGKKAEYGTTLLREIERIWAGSLIATVYFVCFSEPLTRALYGGGRFQSEDVRVTAEVLKYFGPGMFFLTVQGLLSRGFYASQKTWLPSLVGGLTSILSIGLYFTLEKTLGVRGLALAGSLSFGFYALTLWFLLRHHLRVSCPELSFKSFYLFCGSWVLVGIVCVFLSEGVLALGFYQDSKGSAFLTCLIGFLALASVSLFSIRKVFHKMTAGPLF